MALPTNLANKIKAIPMNPSVLANDLELAYLLSFSHFPITHNSVYCYPRDIYQSPLQNYQYADFQDEAFDQLLQQTQKNYKFKNRQVVKGIRSGFKQFYARVAGNTHLATLKYLIKDKNQVEKKITLAKEDEQYRIESLKGNSPTRWPESIREFTKELNALPWHAFSNDSQYSLIDFVVNAKVAITNFCKKVKVYERLDPQQKENLSLEIEGLIGVVLRTNNQAFILQNLSFLQQIPKFFEIKDSDEYQICEKIYEYTQNFFKAIPKQSSTKYHFPENLWNRQSFLVMKKIHFQKCAGLGYYSIANDGKYLYFYVSAINGGMYKIGTGYQGTKAGKIYLERQLHSQINQKPDEISWVFLKDKLYLKNSSKDPWFIDIINPQTFKKQNSIQLFCPSLFGQQSLVNINKNTPLMTDGKSLYYLGSRIKISKASEIEKVQRNEADKQKQKEKEKQDDPNKKAVQKKKKKIKKNDAQSNPDDQKNQNYQKILQIVLYEFDVDGCRTHQNQSLNQSQVQQIYDSFSGYFTKQQCRKALYLNNYDLIEASQWLFNQGEKQKQKNIKIIQEVRFVILCESEITSNFQQKGIKGPNEIVTKDGSILNIFNINESIWTMDSEQITCYTENGVKVFSKNPENFKMNVQTKLSSTLIKFVQSKFPRNPQYNIIYDPYNSIFFTFSWPTDGHYFPAPLLVSNDRKKAIIQEQKKRNQASIQKSRKLSDFSKFVLYQMNILDKSALKTKYRFNDWLWFYGQKINQIAQQLNLPDSDKKRLSNKRAKVLIKMNKINEMEKIYQKDKAALLKNGKVVKQIIKLLPFQAEGTLKNCELINNSFKNILDRPDDTYAYVLCIESWLKNCSTIIDADLRSKIIFIGDILVKLKEKCSSKSKSLIRTLLFREVYLFFPKVEQLIKFLISLSHEQLSQFLSIQSTVQKIEKESIVYELTKKQQIVQKFETNKCDFLDIFKNKSNINTSDVESNGNIGNILLSDLIKSDKEQIIVIDKIDEKLKKEFQQFLQKSIIQSQNGNKFFEYLFLSSFKMLSQSNKNSSLFLKYLTQLFIQTFKIYQKTINKIKNQHFFQTLQTLLLVVQLYHASLVPLTPRTQIITSLNKIIEAVQRPEFNQIFNIIQETQYEGLSPTSQKIYQTCHPLERGKNYSFPPRNFPQASLLFIQLDKRCQSDPNNDIMTIQLMHQENQIGNHIVVNDGTFNSILKMTGNVDTKRPYLLFGNSVTVDISSGGQAKDAQSLGRYGFRFGLRPIYASKNKYNPQKKHQVQRIFKSVSNCETFLYFLKFAVVSLSNTIENSLQYENQVTDQKVNQILKGKIFKQGFQENSYKYETLNPQSYVENINKLIFGTDIQSEDKAILKKNHQKYWKKVELKQNQQKNQTQTILWNFQGIPTYIKGYLEQIKNFKGDFIDVFLEARQLAKEKGSYASILVKPTFQRARQFWLQGEAILFLTVLKHSGLLHLNLKFSIEYIKQNLKAFEEARDGIFYSFISRTNNVNEWRNLIQTYQGKNEDESQEIKQNNQQAEEKKGKTKQISQVVLKRKGKTVNTIKFDQKDKNVKKQTNEEKPIVKKEINKVKIQRQIRQRLSNNEIVKGICNLKKIKYDSINPYQNVTRIIQQLAKISHIPLEKPQAVYTEPINHLISSCLFLLKFKSPSTKQSLQSNQQIVPVSLGRSLSSDNRNVDTNKVNIFREWLQNFKKWKGFKKQGFIELRFPVQQIVKYINSWISNEEIQKVIKIRYNRCENRNLFYSQICNLFKSLEGKSYLKYIAGSQTINLVSNYYSDLQSVPALKLKQLTDSYNQFKNNLKHFENDILKKLPTSLKQLQDQIKLSPKILDKIKLLGNIIFLVESQNPEISLNICLYFISFKYLSHSFEDLVFISTLIVQKGMISNHTIDEVISCLNKQIGNNNIAYKRWKDLFFVQRVLFLLRKLEILCRKKLQFKDKIRTAQILFYILYHIDVPLIARLSLKILKRLKLNLKKDLKTPHDYQYIMLQLNQKQELQEKSRFKLPSLNLSNIQLLCTKITNIFNAKKSNPLKQKFEIEKESNAVEQRYNVILNLHQQEDIFWMIKVLYYLQEIEIKTKQKTLNQIKDWEQYLALKNKKKQENKKQHVQNNQGEKQKQKPKEKEGQRILSTIPYKFSKISPQVEKQLPIGWFYNYCNVFTQQIDRPYRESQKNIKISANSNNIQNAIRNNPKNNRNNQNNNNNGRKIWNTPIFTKFAKKYEELTSKPVEQPKQTDTAEQKADFVEYKNVFNRIRKYFFQISTMIDHFSRTGYYLFKEDISKKKMNQIWNLIQYASTNRLRDIPFNIKNNDIKNRLNINQFVPSLNTKLKLSSIKVQHYSYFDSLVAFQSSLNIKSDFISLYYTYLGKKQLAFDDSSAFLPYQDFILLDQPTENEDIEFGKQWIQSNFSKMKKKCQKVYLNDYPNQTYYLSQGGIQSGIKDNILVPANDQSLTLQTCAFENIMTMPKNKNPSDFQSTQLPEQLIEKIQKIIQKGPIKINSKPDIKQCLLLTFYLKKLSYHNLQFVSQQISKQFALKLFKYFQNLKSYKQLSLYKQDIQKLILNLIDNEHQYLHIFGQMQSDSSDDLIEEYILPFKLQKLNSKNEVKRQNLETHSFAKSNYLLKSQPPQIEQNKLLKYWQKNILPRIYEFVKTTLKQIQIDDYWEQMRRPLRINDHTETKKIAFVICDNKLPAGAVIPDANYNWNSLQIEEIFVGENVLVKFPKNKSQVYTPLLCWGQQDYRLAKVVFIDIKNNSVLVRYRVEQLGIFSYTWVPVNSLMPVQKQVMQIPTVNIYEQLEKKFQGMIYLYGKQCLTKLAPSVPQIDNLKLIKETILDLFIKCPISGIFDFPKPVWPMRPILQKMLNQKNYAVIQMLEKHFCEIHGIDINLNSQKIIELNRFDDAKALIVTFKKQAKFSQCSGIKFFTDKYGYNEIAHVYTAKRQKTDLQPLEFNDPNVYCKFYTNKQCLPIAQQNSYKIHPLEATIFAIDQYWTIGCYIAEVISQIAYNHGGVEYIDVLKRISQIFFKWILKKSVGVLCNYLCRLISKICLTIIFLCEKNNIQLTVDQLGLNINQLKQLVNWINILTAEETKQVVALYTSLLQNLSELAASILIKLPSVSLTVPQHIKAQIDLIKMFKELDNFIKHKKTNLEIGNQPPSYQWERVLQIKNIPNYFDSKVIEKKMKEIIQQNKGKILCPKYDVFIKNGNCIILVDGWDITQLVEEEVIEKIQQEQEEKQQEQQQTLMSWICSQCTFQNSVQLDACDMCGSAAPPPAKVQVYDVVEATDLKMAEKKLRQKEANRFEQVKKQIVEYFENEWKIYCENEVKKRNELENKQKNKDPKKKKVEVAKEQALQIPPKPLIVLKTGSSIFEDEAIEDFLRIRYQKLISELKRLTESEGTYLAKFKKLLSLGYDLWGDNITNQNATLINFNHLYLLMDYIQVEICKGSSSVLSYSQQSIRILSQIPLLDDKEGQDPINYNSENDIGVRAKYKLLATLKSYNIRFSWKVVKQLNLAASKCLQFVNMDLKYDKERNDTYPHYNDCLGYKIKYFRNLIMGVIKLELQQKIMQKTSVLREMDEVPKIYLERLKYRQERTKEKLVTVKEKEDHLFTKAHDQFLKITPAFLRPFKPRGTDPYLSFNVSFRGENVMGEAGPYRQFFTDIARQLHPQYNLGLFVPSPNNKNQQGEFKSRWIINPKANSTYHFSLFEYIGILMGCCLRTGAHLALDLPTLFWKQITHQQITDQDLQQIDLSFINMIRMFQNCPQEDAFAIAVSCYGSDSLPWTYTTSDGDIHELIPNGKNLPVQFKDLKIYIDMLKVKKINESKLQIKRIIQGLSQLMPLPYLNLLTGEELRLAVCGRPKVDVDLLKKHTKYSGGLNEQSRRIKFFWEIIRELDEKQRLKIIRFCWGQQRLPVNSQQFERNNIRFMIKPMLSANKNQDLALPKADTCFFNIELPDYSTKAIMKQRILLAVNLDSVSINADENNGDDNPLMNEIQEYGQDEQYDEETYVNRQGRQEW